MERRVIFYGGEVKFQTNEVTYVHYLVIIHFFFKILNAQIKDKNLMLLELKQTVPDFDQFIQGEIFLFVCLTIEEVCDFRVGSIFIGENLSDVDKSVIRSWWHFGLAM